MLGLRVQRASLDVPGLVVDLKEMQTRQQGLLLAGVIGHGEQGWGMFGNLKRRL